MGRGNSSKPSLLVLPSDCARRALAKAGADIVTLGARAAAQQAYEKHSQALMRAVARNIKLRGSKRFATKRDVVHAAADLGYIVYA